MMYMFLRLLTPTNLWQSFFFIGSPPSLGSLSQSLSAVSIARASFFVGSQNILILKLSLTIYFISSNIMTKSLTIFIVFKNRYTDTY